MTMNTIMEAALEEYEYYYSDFETDDSDTVANALHDALMTKDYQNCPYLSGALSVYYQLTKNNYQTTHIATEKHDCETTMQQIKQYANEHQMEI